MRLGVVGILTWLCEMSVCFRHYIIIQATFLCFWRQKASIIYIVSASFWEAHHFRLGKIAICRHTHFVKSGH